MREVENQQQSRQQDLLFAVGLSLAVAVVLAIVGAIITATGDSFSHISGRDRVEIVGAAGANIITAMLVLGAVVALPNAGAAFSIGLSQGGAFRDRFATVLPQIGTVLIALVAMVGGNRLGNAPDGHDVAGASPV